MKRDKRRRKSSPKQSLNLPDLDHAKSAVLNSLPSKEFQQVSELSLFGSAARGEMGRDSDFD